MIVTKHLVVIATILASASASAELVSSGLQEWGFPTFAGLEIDVNGDGVHDFVIRQRSLGTTDLLRSATCTKVAVRGLAGNLILCKRRREPWALHLRQLGAVLPENRRWASGWVTVAQLRSSLILGSEPPKYERNPWTEPWEDFGKGYILGAFKTEGEIRAAWLHIDFTGSPRLIDWHYDTEPLNEESRRSVPVIRDIARPEDKSQAGVTFQFEQLIYGHQYFLETSDDLEAGRWRTIHSFTKSDRHERPISIDWRLPAKTRFYRLRHQWPGE